MLYEYEKKESFDSFEQWYGAFSRYLSYYNITLKNFKSKFGPEEIKKDDILEIKKITDKSYSSHLIISQYKEIIDKALRVSIKDDLVDFSDYEDTLNKLSKTLASEHEQYINAKKENEKYQSIYEKYLKIDNKKETEKKKTEKKENELKKTKSQRQLTAERLQKLQQRQKLQQLQKQSKDQGKKK